MKKILSLLLTLLFTALLCVACQTDPGKMEPYSPPQISTSKKIVIDQNMTIDGVLDEPAWTECKNSQTTASKLARGGQMEVMTYFGEEAFYFAWRVEDYALYFNKERALSNNTGIELYFSNINHDMFEIGCYSLRLGIINEEGEVSSAIFRYGLNRWVVDKNQGQYVASATVDGTLNDKIFNDKGYTVECAISYDLLGGKTDSVQYTSSFIQTYSYSLTVKRDANTFLSETHYLRPSTWRAVNNDGLFDKTAVLDAQVVTDADMTIDGKLDEQVWVDKISGNEGKTFTYTGTHSSLQGAEYGIYTHLTDKGVYIGMDSTDKYVYAFNDRPVKYDTGMELFVVSKGASKYDTASSKQIRFSVSGRVQRFDAYTSTGSLWVVGSFPLKSAGSVKSGAINSSETEGWQGEIFIPWGSLGVTDNTHKRQIAILPAGVYHSTNTTATDGDTAGWKYFSPVGTSLYKDTTIDIQKTYLRFNKETGFIHNAVEASVPDININDVETLDGEEYYVIDVETAFSNTIKSGDFTSAHDSEVVEEIEDEDSVVATFDDLGNGVYRLYLKKDSLEKFKGDGAFVTLINETNALEKQINLRYDENSIVDGVINDNDAVIKALYDESKTAEISSFVGAASFTNSFVASVKDGFVYFASVVTDSDVREYESGLDFYFSASNVVEVGKAMRISVRAGGAVDTYLYKGVGEWGLENSLVDFVKVVLSKTADGYVVEGRFAYSALSGQVSENIWLLPAIRLSTNRAKSNYMTMLGNKIFTNDLTSSINNYLRFGKEGFTPDKLFAPMGSVTFTDGKTVSGSESEGFTGSKAVQLSYLQYGGMTSDSTVMINIDTEAGEAFPLTYIVEKEGLQAEVPLIYAKGNASNFDASKVDAFINFDYYAENLVADTYTNYLEVDTHPSIAVNPNEKSYEGDKSYNANMRTRWLRMPYECGNESFTVSMTLNCEALRRMQTSHYSFIIFGTGNVDNATEGFSFRARGEFWQIRVPNNAYSTIVGMEKLVGFKRLTVSVERTSKGADFHIWLEDERLTTVSTTFTGSLDIAQYGKMGFGGPGSYKETNSYPNSTVNMDDIIVFRGVVSEPQQIYDMTAYIDDMNAKSRFTIAEREIKFDFNDFDGATEIEKTITIQGGNSVTFGGEWADYITSEGGEYKLKLTRAQAETFKQTEVCSYTQNGITKFVKLTFNDLLSAKTEKSEYGYWPNATLEQYLVTVKALTDEGIAIDSGNGVQFATTTANLLDSWTEKGNGEYILKLNKAVADTITEADFTLSIDGKTEIEPYSFKLVRNALTEEEKTALKNKMLAYLNYDGDNGIANLMGGDTEMTKAVDATNGIKVRNGNDKYFQAGTENNRMAIKGISLGKEDFTISFDALIDENSFNGTNASYELISSTTGTADQPKSSLQISMLGTSDTMRIQVGRNDMQTFVWSDHITTTNGGVKLGQWVRYTVVVDRNVASVAGRSKHHDRYGADGEWYGGSTKVTDNAVKYLVEEDVNVSVYVDGVCFGTVTLNLSGQDIGYDDTLYIGGNFAWGSTDLISGIDNVVVCRGVMTEREILATPEICNELIA